MAVEAVGSSPPSKDQFNKFLIPDLGLSSSTSIFSASSSSGIPLVLLSPVNLRLT